MINLVGVIHSHTRYSPEIIDNVMNSYKFDHIFTEDMSTEVFETSLDDKKLYTRVKKEVSDDIFEKQYFKKAQKDCKQGPEAEHIEKEVGPEKVTFLDNKHPLYQLTYAIKDSIEPNFDPKDKGISSKTLEQKIDNENDTEEDYLNYFRSIQNRVGFNYAAISDKKRFQEYKETLSEEFQLKVDDQLLQTLDMDRNKTQEQFLEAFDEYDLDRFTFQDIIHESRSHNFQDRRDTSWYNQITEYHDNNPDDNVLVFCGLNHLTRNENTLRQRMEEGGYEDSMYVKPINHSLFSR